MRPTFEYELVTAPASEPITLAEAKSACRVLSTDEDSFIALLVSAAVALLDGPLGYLGQAIVDQKWTVRCGPAGVCGALALPFGPVSAVTGLKTHDGTTLNTANLADYRILYGKFTTTIEPISGTWPALADRADALQVTFQAGAADAGPVVKSVSASVKLALLGLVAHWFNNREAVVVGAGITATEVPLGVEAMLINERRF